jgi:toxin ParE1/3/4
MADVIWAEPALYSLQEVTDYISLDNPDAARVLVGKVFQTIDLLERNPELGNVPSELKNTPYRRLVISPIYLYYRVDDEKIRIVFVDRTERKFDLRHLNR